MKSIMSGMLCIGMTLACSSIQAEMVQSQWKGKKVAFLGDSITDKNHIGTTKNYWNYLPEFLGIESLVYGINGEQMAGILAQAKRLKAEHPDDVDAIFVFAGTNDFNGGIPLGSWWTLGKEEVNSHGRIMTKERRKLNKDMGTFCGRTNAVMEYLKQEFPLQQIVLMTPIHRGFATFGGDNIQPEESFPNDIGIYLESYVEMLRQAADIWAVNVIDLYRVSGLHPLTASHGGFFNNRETDLLHPNAQGHYRIAKAMMYQMLAMPADFK